MPKPLTTADYLERPLAQLWEQPAALPQAQQAQHDTWVRAFELALLRDLGHAPFAPRDATALRPDAPDMSIQELMRAYEQRVSQPLGRTAPVDAMIRYLDRLVSEPDRHWNGACTTLYAFMQDDSVLTYRHQKLAIPVLEHWLDQGPRNRLAKNLWDDYRLDEENGEQPRIAVALRQAAEAGHAQQVRDAWRFISGYDRPALAVQWAHADLSPALDQVWAIPADRFEVWSSAFAYGLFNQAPALVMGRLWAAVGEAGHVPLLDVVEGWLYARPMDEEAEFDDEPEFQPDRVLTLLQRRDDLRGTVPVAFWTQVPSVRAHLRQSELAQTPASPPRRPRRRA